MSPRVRPPASLQLGHGRRPQEALRRGRVEVGGGFGRGVWRFSRAILRDLALSSPKTVSKLDSSVARDLLGKDAKSRLTEAAASAFMKDRPKHARCGRTRS